MSHTSHCRLLGLHRIAAVCIFRFDFAFHRTHSAWILKQAEPISPTEPFHSCTHTHTASQLCVNAFPFPAGLCLKAFCKQGPFLSLLCKHQPAFMFVSLDKNTMAGMAETFQVLSSHWPEQCSQSRACKKYGILYLDSKEQYGKIGNLIFQLNIGYSSKSCNCLIFTNFL